MPEICPSTEAVSATTGLSFSSLQANEAEVDFIGSDPETGATFCSYTTAESDILAIGFHGSPIDSTLFLDVPPPDAEVNELPSGAIQLQFDGQVGCEVYDDQLSVVLITEADLADSCAVVNDAAEAMQ